MRRAPFAVAIVCAAALIAIPLAAGQVNGSRAADEVVEGASPLLTKESLRGFRQGLSRIQETSTAFVDVGLPRLAGETPAEFRGFLAREHPEVSASLPKLPEIEAQADMVVSNLEKRQSQFDSATSLPGLGLSLNQGVWAGLLFGSFVLGVGVAGLVRPRRALSIVLLVMGLGAVIGPLALSYPSKTSDTDAILDSLRPFTAEKVEAREKSLAATQRLFTALREDVLPRVAADAGRTAGEAERVLAEASPALSSASLEAAEAAIERFAAAVRFSARIQPLLVEADDLSARESMWLFLGPGALLVLAGGAGLSRPRSS